MDPFRSKLLQNRSLNEAAEAKKVDFDQKRTRIGSKKDILGPKSDQNESPREVKGPEMRVLGSKMMHF